MVNIQMIGSSFTAALLICAISPRAFAGEFQGQASAPEVIAPNEGKAQLGSEAKYEVKAGGISMGLGMNGAIVNARVGDAKVAWPVSGETRLNGFQADGEVEVTVSGISDTMTFSRRQKDSLGHICIVRDRFTPDKDCIRWDVDITSPDASWTTPVISRLQCARPEEKLIWTAWGSPDYAGAQLAPELAALVQAGKASVSGAWSDPLVPVGFLNRRWHYGNVAQNCPVDGDYVALPLFTLLSPVSDTGLSLVLAPDDVLLTMDLDVTASGQVQYTRSNHRFGTGRTVSFTSYLVPHESSWRGGLRFLTARYPGYFNAPNPRVHQLSGCGAYSICESPIDVAKFRKMALGFNWKLSDDFPYMGMFIPPVRDADEKWTRSCDEQTPPEKGPTTSCRQMNDYANYMRLNGFSVLNYFNVTEFGKNMYGRPATAREDDPALWKDPVAYLKHRLPHAVFDPGIHTCYDAFITDPGDPDYLEFMLEQADRYNRLIPASDGICIDRTDWLRLYNPAADDGVSLVNGKPARSLFRSWADLMARLGPLMHKADKVIFSNLMTMRLELGKELDGIYTEFGNNGNALNASAMLGTRKPVVAWTYNETLGQPDPDSFMQRHLHLGVFPTAPYPYNNHCINPEPSADRLYMDYGPLLGAMRGKKWVLEARCVESTTPGVKVNLFEVPGGYALPVTFGGNAKSATVILRDLPGLARLRCEVLHPGATEVPTLKTTPGDGSLSFEVPLQRGCAMLRLRNP